MNRTKLIENLRAQNLLKHPKTQLELSLSRLGADFSRHPWIPEIKAQELDVADCRAWLWLLLAGARPAQVTKYGSRMRDLVGLSASALRVRVGALTNQAPYTAAWRLLVIAADHFALQDPGAEVGNEILLRQQVTTTNEELTRTRAELAGVREQMAVVRSQNQTFAEQQEKEDLRVETLRRQLDAETRRRMAAVERSQGSRERARAQRESANAAAQERDRWRAEAERLEAEFSQLADVNHRVTDANSEMLREQERLLEEVTALRQEIARLQQDSERQAEMGQEREVLLDQIGRTQQELGNLQQAYDHIVSENESLRAEVEKRQAFITSLQEWVRGGGQSGTGPGPTGVQGQQGEDPQKLAEAQQAALRRAEEEREARRRALRERKGNILVMPRIRPDQSDEADPRLSTDGSSRILIRHDEGSEPLVLNFDHVFSSTEDNRAVFQQLSPFVQLAIDGQSTAIMCYGQTGSGKSYTVSEGPAAIIPSALAMIFEEAQANSHEMAGMAVEITAIEIYQGKAFDLLRVDSPRRLQQTQPPITNEVRSLEEGTRLLMDAAARRSTATTNFNTVSSRSHSIVTVNIRRPTAQGGQETGVISIVDLAGSEDIKDVEMNVRRKAEGQQIMKDLEEVRRYLDSLIGSGPVATTENGSWLLERLSATVRRGARVVIITTVAEIRLGASG